MAVSLGSVSQTQLKAILIPPETNSGHSLAHLLYTPPAGGQPWRKQQTSPVLLPTPQGQQQLPFWDDETEKSLMFKSLILHKEMLREMMYSTRHISVSLWESHGLPQTSH